MDALFTEYNLWWLGLSAIALVLNLLAYALFRKSWLDVTSLLHFMCVFLGTLNVIFGQTGNVVFSVPVLLINLVFMTLNIGAWFLSDRLTPEEDKKEAES